MGTLGVSFLVQLAVYATRPTVSYRALQLGADGHTLGVVVAAYAVLSLVLAIPVGTWIDRWGHRPFLFVGVASVFLVTLALPRVDSLVVLATSLALVGLGHLLVTVSAQTLIAAKAGRQGSLSAFSLFTVVVSLGQLAGPLLLGVLGGSGSVDQRAPAAADVQVTPVFLAASGAAGVALAVVFWLPKERAARRDPDARQERPTGIVRGGLRVLRSPNMTRAMFISLSVLASVDVLIAYLPAYGESSGLSVRTVGLLLATLSGAGLASRLLMWPAARRMGIGSVLVVSTTVACASVALFPALVSTPWALFLVIGGAGLGLGLGQPLTLTWVARTAPTEIRGTALGVRLAGNRLGQVAVPAAVGALTGAAGLVAVFWAVTAMLGTSALVAVRGRAFFDD
ncbi:MAG: MFS transporter [Actinomycetes bacterium]